MADRNAIVQNPSPPVPPPPPPRTFNLPCQALLADNRRRDFISICVPLCQASIKGDWKAAEDILQNRRYMVRHGITENYETALHVAASAESTSFMVDLVKMMTKEDLELQTKNGDTALCLVAAAGNVKMARFMVTKNEKLLKIPGSEGLIPLTVAALYGKHNMVNYLYDKCKKMEGPEWKTSTKHWLFLKCVELDLFDIALELFKDHEELSHSESVLRLLARKPSAFSEPKSHFFNRITSIIYWKAKVVAKESEARQLLRMIWANIVERPKVEVDKILKGPGTSINGKLTYSSPILFVATEMGNTEFVVELVRKYPDLIWNKNENNQSLFHIAVCHRHESIYNLLHEIGSMKDLITRLRDIERNNMLHLVGLVNSEKNQSQKVSGVAFQIQRELLWFKEVESMIPPYYREEKNKAGQTPRELFTKNHKGLVSEGEKWMKETASQCMVVATLITTVVFAVAFTFPGGYNQNSGLPMFLENGTFITFVILDAISLILSSTSILVFLSILTSRYAEQDFLESLPRKLLIGLATLFLSIISMMVAFSVSFFVLYHEKFIGVPICISTIAVIPIIAFAFLHRRLLMDVFQSIIRSRSLFKPKNQLFYYQNPRF